MSKVSVRVADWKEDAAIREIRQAVFVKEQQVPVELEWDEEDPSATHFLLLLEEQAGARPVQQAIGTARLLSNGTIGRVAVVAEYRGLGFGRMLMLEIMGHAQRQGMTQLRLSAQTHALDFYQRLGFKPCSSAYMDAGIPHRDMYWDAVRDR